MVNKTVLPLSPTDMVAFFKNKDAEFTIDYEASLANLSNPKFLLMYIANLGLKCNIDTITPKLMKEYMQLKEFADILNLKLTHANILYLAKFGEMLFTDNEYLWSMDDCIEFAKNHNSLLLNQMAFLNSIPLYVLTKLNATEGEQHGPYKDLLVRTVSDEKFDDIGYSTVQLFTVSSFLLRYLHANVPLEDQIYYTQYFDEYMFNGSNIFAYIMNDKNEYACLCQLAASADAGDADAITTLEDIMNKMNTIITSSDVPS